MTHSFTSFSAAATEAENSVVWSGTHFRFDVMAGNAQGRSVAGQARPDPFAASELQSL